MTQRAGGGEGEGRLRKEGRDVYIQLIQNQSQVPYEYTVEVTNRQSA